MKKILLIDDGGLPLPSIDGGAVETLANMYLEENERRRNFQFDVYSSFSKNIKEYITLKYQYCNFYYIQDRGIMYMIRKYIRAFFKKILKRDVDPVFAYEVLDKIGDKQYDLVIVENAPNLVHSLYKKFGDKIVLHLHNDYLNINTNNAINILKECKKIYTVSNFIKNKVDEIEENTKTEVIFNGLDLEKFNIQNAKEQRKIWRKKYGIGNDDIVFIFSGRICDDKGVKELIRAFNKICKEYKNVKMLIVGSSFFKVKKKNNYINSLIKLSKINKENIIFTGYIDYDSMPKIYNMADVLVLPSKIDDACPMTVLEAMAIGLPIIASNCGGIPEEVSESNAILLDRNNLESEIYEAVKNITQDEKIRKQMSKSSYERARKFDKKYYLEKIFERLS